MDLSKVRWQDVINPKKWWAFIDAKLAERYTSIEYCEQVVYRSIMCSECYANKSCLHCGCSSPSNFMSPSNFCSGGNWGAMRSKEDWNTYKKERGLNFEIIIEPKIDKI